MRVDGVGRWPVAPGSEAPALAKNRFSFTHEADKLKLKLHLKSAGGPLHASHLRRYAEQLSTVVRGLDPSGDQDLQGLDGFEHRPASPDHSAWGGDVFDPHFSSGTETPAVARSVVEDAAKPLSRTGRAMAMLAKGLYGGGRFIATKSAGAVSSVARWGWREITHNPIGTLMLLGAASKGYVGNRWMPDKFGQAIEKVLQTDSGANPVHVLAAQGLGAAFNRQQGARVLREAKHFVRPETRSLPRKLWHGAQFIADKARPVVERVTSDPVDTGGKMLVGGFLLGRNSKVGKAVVSGAGTLLTVAKILYSPFDHMNPWSRRGPGRHRGGW